MHTHPAIPVKSTAAAVKPVLKWTGGKSRIVDEILGHLPRGRRLIEPFVGSGAVFLASSYERYLLGDANRHLIDLYKCIVDRFDELVASASPYFSESFRSKERYLAVRRAFNEAQDPLERSAQFLYLNRLGFNGLCRYNRSGGFNVPYGNPATMPKFPLERQLSFREKASNASFTCRDFADVMQMARRGDVVYCDPPYLDRTVGMKTFTGYSASGFTYDRQQELATMARVLASRGIPVLISNHDCEDARNLYDGAEIFQFDVRRSVSADATRRGTAAEVLALFT